MDEFLESRIQDADNLLDGLVDFVPFDEVLDRGVEELNAVKAKDIMSFGYDWLDNQLTGFFPGDLVIIGGETGTGKTTFATNIIYKASKTKKCVVFALEDRLNDYAIKAIYFEIGKIRGELGLKNYPWNAYRRNEIKDVNYPKLRQEAVTRLQTGNIFFADVKKQMTIEMLEEAIQRQVENGVETFLIDHLHYFDLMKGDGSKADYIETVMTRIKTLQSQTGAKILMVVHYKKLGGAKPSMDSFKDSSAIAQNANYTLHLWRDRTLGASEEDQKKTLLYIPKTRNPNGEATFELEFDRSMNDYKLLDNNFGTGESKEWSVDEKDMFK